MALVKSATARWRSPLASKLRPLEMKMLASLGRMLDAPAQVGDDEIVLAFGAIAFGALGVGRRIVWVSLDCSWRSWRWRCRLAFGLEAQALRVVGELAPDADACDDERQPQARQIRAQHDLSGPPCKEGRFAWRQRAPAARSSSVRRGNWSRPTSANRTIWIIGPIDWLSEKNANFRLRVEDDNAERNEAYGGRRLRR